MAGDEGVGVLGKGTFQIRLGDGHRHVAFIGGVLAIGVHRPVVDRVGARIGGGGEGAAPPALSLQPVAQICPFQGAAGGGEKLLLLPGVAQVLRRGHRHDHAAPGDDLQLIPGGLLTGVVALLMRCDGGGDAHRAGAVDGQLASILVNLRDGGGVAPRRQGDGVGDSQRLLILFGDSPAGGGVFQRQGVVVIALLHVDGHAV